jgi:hypothetical protein
MRTLARAQGHVLSAGVALLLGLFLCISTYSVSGHGLSVFLATVALATIVSWRATDVTPARSAEHG